MKPMILTTVLLFLIGVFAKGPCLNELTTLREGEREAEEFQAFFRPFVAQADYQDASWFDEAEKHYNSMIYHFYNCEAREAHRRFGKIQYKIHHGQQMDEGYNAFAEELFEFLGHYYTWISVCYTRMESYLKSGYCNPPKV